MSITTIDQLQSSLMTPIEFSKDTYLHSGSAHFSLAYQNGNPGGMSIPNPGASGEALTYLSGQLEFVDPASGSTKYIVGAKFVSSEYSASPANSVPGTVLVCDRLWHGGQFAGTDVTLQSVNSVTFPSRDVNGSSSGVGVMVAVEVTSACGNAAPIATVTYTNSDGTSGRTGTAQLSTLPNKGQMYAVTLQAGDTGVRSVQSVQLSTSWLSGTYVLVAYRCIVKTSIDRSYSLPGRQWADSISLGMPKVYSGSVLYLVVLLNKSAWLSVVGSLIFAQG